MRWNTLLLLFQAMMILAMASPLLGQGGQDGGSPVTMGAQVERGLQLSLAGGTNPLGKKTFFSGNTIDFGAVTFTQPELITNGDAYLEIGKLRLEAVLNMNLVFGGVASVTLDLTKLKASANSFRETYYSTSINRSDPLTVILQEPQKNRLQTLTASAEVPIRIVLDSNARVPIGAQVGARFRPVAHWRRARRAALRR